MSSFIYVLTISYFIPQIFFTFDIYCFILIFRQKEPDNLAGKGISLMQISAKNVNTPSVFPMDCEVYYSIRTLIDANEYPQVHDFYEIILVTENSLDILLNNDRIKLGQGNLLLIRPGDIHTKIQTGDSVHINLAFPAYTVNSLFGYLYNSQAPRKELFVGSHSPIVRLSTIDTLMIQNRLSFLNQLSSSDMEEKMPISEQSLLTLCIPISFLNWKNKKGPRMPPICLPGLFLHWRDYPIPKT